MPERSLPLVLTPRSSDTTLLDSLAPLLAEWLPRQRWFAGKGAPVGGLTLVAATELLPCNGPDTAAPGLLHLLLRVQNTGPAATAADHGAADCYQLLIGVRSVLPPELGPARIGRPPAGPLRGRTVYEALHDPRLTGLLLERLRTPGRLGPLRFARGSGETIPSGLPPRLLEAEQTNSSVVYGSACILKLFRRVGAGTNPDLELPLALAEAGCAHVPAPTAWFEATAPQPGGPVLTLGVLQPYLAGSDDGWQLALEALDAGRDFTAPARALGRTTAEVHAGLAEALPTTELGRTELEQLASAMTERLHAAANAVPALRPYRAGLRRAFTALSEPAAAGHIRHAQRIHGDLHLGQALRTAARDRWCLIDFEGEPARPLAERRRPQPVVRDVAGMLRSFDYAAGQRGSGPGQSADRAADRTADRAAGWAAACRAAYCRGYAEASGTDPRDDAPLLRAFETDKAVYEVLYEARHRPAWLPIPLSAVRRLAAAGPRR